MTTLMQASHQWASRPADERFTSLPELYRVSEARRQASTAKVISSRSIECQPVEGDSRALLVVGPNGAPVAPNNWSFGQLAQLAGAPPGYLRDLPAPLAADCINYGMLTRDISDIGTLVRSPDEGVTGPDILAAATGPNYGRIWNSTITKILIDRFGDGRSGPFKVPGEFGKDVEITKANTTLFAGDRDMFVFLADEKNRIEMPNRRDGKAGTLARGFFVWNSEVGSRSYGLAMFLFDYVCCNRIVWGVSEFSQIVGRHTASAPDKLIYEVAPAIEAYANSSARGVTEAIEAAQSKKVDDVNAFLAKRFSKGRVAAIVAAHQADEQRPIENLWDVATGITAYARGVQWQDERVKLERIAGEILDKAA